jgi:multiple sugar transport system substrate-binding protein
MRNAPRSSRPRWRVVGATAAAAVAATGLAGSASAHTPESGGEPVEISFVGTQPPELLEPVIDAFEASQDRITVRYEAVPFEELSAIIAQRVGGGTGDIDVFYADAPRNPSIVDAGYALDLTDVIGVEALEGVVPDASIETAVIDGRLWTVPMRTSTQILYYNIDLLEQAGIEAPSMDPEERITWEELKELSIQAQEAGATWGYIDDQVSRYYQFQPLPESLGGGAGLSGDEGLEVDLTNEGWIQATEFWASLYEEGIAPRGVAPNDTKPIFINGEAAFMPGGPWWIPDFAANEELNFGIAAFPYFADGEPVTPTDSEHLAIDSNTEHVDEAVEFVRFVTLTEEGALAMASGLAVPTANLEALPTQLADLEAARPTLAGFAELATYEIENTAVPRPFSVGYVEFETLIGDALEDIRNGADVEDRLTQAEEEIERAFAR